MELNKYPIELLMRTTGYDVSKYDDSFLLSTLQKRIFETNSKSMENYFVFLEQNSLERAELIESLRISYSEFFRNSLTFAVLERIIVPSIVMKRDKTKHKDVRIWSVACAGGQEAYSLAILLEEISNGDKAQGYRIFATDQSETQIHDAVNGQFPSASLNNVSLKRLKERFTKHNDMYAIKPELKENMAFSVFDLFSEKMTCPPESIYGDFDLIFCANLLFYYKDDYRKSILHKMRNSLAVGGYLITGEVERDILLRYKYREVYPYSAIFQV